MLVPKKTMIIMNFSIKDLPVSNLIIIVLYCVILIYCEVKQVSLIYI